jgi:hypothetical protein
MSGRRKRGARVLHGPDWPFGSNGRRLVIRALLCDPEPAQGWTKKALEQRAGLSKGAAEELLAGLLLWGVAVREGATFRAVRPLTPVAAALRTLLIEADAMPDKPVPTLAKRHYRRQPQRPPPKSDSR